LLDIYGWFNGLTALLVVIFATIFGTIFAFRAKKLNANLLKYGALMGIFAGFLWMAPMIDFLFMAITQGHLTQVMDIRMYGVLSYMWVGPAFLCAMYVGLELQYPDKKKIFFAFFIPLCIIFEIVLFVDASNTFKFSEESTVDLIDSTFQYTSPAFIMIAIFLLFIFLLNGIGALRKAAQSTGDIRKNFLYLAVSFNLFIIVAVFDAFIPAGSILSIARLGMIVCAWSMYLALKGD